MERAPDEVGGGLAFITAPPEEFVPEEPRGKPACGVIVVYVGDPQRGRGGRQAAASSGASRSSKMVQPMPYVAVQQMLDGGNPWGIGEYFKVDYLGELPDEAIDTAIDQAAGRRVAVHADHPRAARRRDVATDTRRDGAQRARTRSGSTSTSRCGWTRSLAEAERDWARAFMEAMRPWAAGKAPPNFVAADEGVDAAAGLVRRGEVRAAGRR